MVARGRDRGTILRGGDRDLGGRAILFVVVGVAAGACSSKPRTEEATPAAAVRADAAASDSAAAASAGAGTRPDMGSGGRPGEPVGATPTGNSAGAAHTGDLQVRVEWPDVPVGARRSPGRTPCGTPRTPSVAPTTTWGVPDALVIIDGAAAGLAEAHVTLADCTLGPRIAVGGSLAVTSAIDRPARLVLRKRGPIGHLVPGDPIGVMLPIAGHTVTAALDTGAIYALETDAPDPEVAFIAALPGGVVTDASGQVTVHELSVGPHAVTAWLPPRAGQPVRTGHATATVAAGDLAELTITLAP